MTKSGNIEIYIDPAGKDKKELNRIKKEIREEMHYRCLFDANYAGCGFVIKAAEKDCGYYIEDDNEIRGAEVMSLITRAETR